MDRRVSYKPSRNSRSRSCHFNHQTLRKKSVLGRGFAEQTEKEGNEGQEVGRENQYLLSEHGARHRLLLQPGEGEKGRGQGGETARSPEIIY